MVQELADGYVKTAHQKCLFEGQFQMLGRTIHFLFKVP